jgi:D-lactate dehydrogenase (cytochrome)
MIIGVSNKHPPQRPFWTIPRTLIFSAFTASSLTYTYVSEASSKRASVVQAFRNKPEYCTRAEMEKAIAELRAEFGEEMISIDDDDLKLHGYSEWSSINIDRLPTAVAYPKSTSDVAKIAKICFKYKIPMIPYSGEYFPSGAINPALHLELQASPVSEIPSCFFVC